LQYGALRRGGPSSHPCGRGAAPLSLPTGHELAVFCALSPSSVHTHARLSFVPAQDNDATAKVASCGSYLSGIIVAIGWYVFLDALLEARTQCITWGPGDTFNPSNCTEVHQNPNLVAPPGLVSGAYWVPGILGTLGTVMLNLISWEAVTDDSAFGDGVSAKAKMWVFVALVLMFCSLGGAIWVLVSDLQFKGKVMKDGHQLDAYHFGGVAVLVQCALLFVGGVLFRAVRREGDHSV